MKDDIIEKKKRSKRDIFKAGLVGGLGWAFGVTIGFAIISVLIIFLVDETSVVPVIGNFVTSVVEYTKQQLETRNPYF